MKDIKLIMRKHQSGINMIGYSQGKKRSHVKLNETLNTYFRRTNRQRNYWKTSQTQYRHIYFNFRPTKRTIRWNWFCSEVVSKYTSKFEEISSQVLLYKTRSKNLVCWILAWSVQSSWLFVLELVLGRYQWRKGTADTRLSIKFSHGESFYLIENIYLVFAKHKAAKRAYLWTYLHFGPEFMKLSFSVYKLCFILLRLKVSAKTIPNNLL